ncbi:sugar fermentation stimulation protein A [Rhodoligotrophos appendicifer]|uniref:DNA/RNA nuclease SfsA n=1 Tax=Rhodoligotrophos appendicifer TaxID=987056 RepID=UPI00118596D0|nr:DNA/RNA nuclease SfsA [Rhodoligotrophos appendicifer]
MKLPAPLHRGRLVRRYKRFLADIQLQTGELITAHCANPGSMLGLMPVGATVWVSRSEDAKRKLPYSWQLLELAGERPVMVGVSTTNPNRIVEEAIRAQQIPELSGYDGLLREVRYGLNSRIDLLLTSSHRPPCYVEIKNVHLSRVPGLAEFPDSVTARGAKHLNELAAATQEGARAVLFYLIQRDDCQTMAIASDLDPAYSRAFTSACMAGVECLVYSCRINLDEIVIDRPLPLRTGNHILKTERVLRES